jgi:hypothetical protein
MIISIILYTIFASIYCAIKGKNLIEWLRGMLNFVILAGLIGIGYLVLLPLFPIVIITLLLIITFYKIKEFKKDKEEGNILPDIDVKDFL